MRSSDYGINNPFPLHERQKRECNERSKNALSHKSGFVLHFYVSRKGCTPGHSFLLLDWIDLKFRSVQYIGSSWTRTSRRGGYSSRWFEVPCIPLVEMRIISDCRLGFGYHGNGFVFLFFGLPNALFTHIETVLPLESRSRFNSITDTIKLVDGS